jgi:hypothetical protein
MTTQTQPFDLDRPTPTFDLDADADLIARLTDSAPRRLVMICAWCPDFRPGTATPGVTHGICPACQARFEQEAA